MPTRMLSRILRSRALRDYPERQCTRHYEPRAPTFPRNPNFTMRGRIMLKSVSNIYVYILLRIFTMPMRTHYKASMLIETRAIFSQVCFQHVSFSIVTVWLLCVIYNCYFCVITFYHRTQDTRSVFCYFQLLTFVNGASGRRKTYLKRLCSNIA